VFGGYFLSLPVRSSRGGIVDLEAIHSDVAFARVGVAGDDARESDEASRVLRPALQDGEVKEGKLIALDDFFAGAGGDGLGKKLSGFGEEWEHFEFVEEALRGFEIHEDADAVGEFVERIHAQRQLHAGFGAELVDKNLGAGVVFYVLKEKGGATGTVQSVVPRSRSRSETWSTHFFVPHVHLADAVGNFGDFKDGINFGSDTFEFAGAVEGGDPLAKIIEGQRESPWNERL